MLVQYIPDIFIVRASFAFYNIRDEVDVLVESLHNISLWR